MYQKLCVLCGFLFIGIFGSIQVVYGSEFSFSVETKIPENQIDKEKTYFDLLLSPGEAQTLTVKLRNDTKNSVTVEALVNSATTNTNGVVEYGKNNIEADPTLRYDLAECVKLPKEIVLAANSEKVVEIDVKMPNEKVSGIIAGGLTFKEKAKDSSEQKSTDHGIAIKNEFSYAVALLMRQSIAQQLTPKLNLTNVVPSQINARNVINANIQNPEALYIKQLAVDAKVYKKGEAEVLYKSFTDGMQMAPNTNFNYPIPLNGEKLHPGKYVLKLTAYAFLDDSGKNISPENKKNYSEKWSFEKEFTIDGDEAKELNLTDVTISDEIVWPYYLIGGLVIMVLLLLLFLLKKKNNGAEDKE